MLIQYSYAILTMLPCPIWFHYRVASAAFLTIVFGWSVYNGSTYYIDVFGKRFQKELEIMKMEVSKWQHTTDIAESPPLASHPDHVHTAELASPSLEAGAEIATHCPMESIDSLQPLSDGSVFYGGMGTGAARLDDDTRERRSRGSRQEGQL